MAIIYLLVDPRTAMVRYVGQTSKPLERRIAVHLCQARKGYQYYSSRWIRELLAEGLQPVPVILEVTDDPSPRERHWIRHFRRAGCRLTNLTDGGEGTLGRICGPVSDETREKIRQAIRGRKHTEEAKAKMKKPKAPRTDEHRQKLSLAVKAYAEANEVSAETRAKISAVHKGSKHTPEHNAKVSAAQKGKKRPPLPEEQKQKISASLKGKTPQNFETLHTPEVNARRAAALVGSRPGYKHTEETRHKISKANKGKPSPRKGQTLTEETKAKLRAANLGKKRGPCSEETKQKISAATTGKPKKPRHTVAVLP